MTAGEQVLISLSKRMLDLDNLIDKQNKRNTYEFVESMKNGNTKVKTKSDLKRVEFLAGFGEHRKIQDVPPEITYLLSSGNSFLPFTKNSFPH